MVPDLVPARMVNEFAYCPRLFHLEWVQARWAENDDTAEGRFAHRAVDHPSGRVPLPEDDGEVRRARSVSLSSERLGLTAVVDVLEGVGDAVRPVDTKKGSVPDVPEGAYEPERVQVCVQGLLLREAQYSGTRSLTGGCWMSRRGYSPRMSLARCRRTLRSPPAEESWTATAISSPTTSAIQNACGTSGRP